MKTPQELMEKVTEYKDIDSLIAVYLEVRGCIDQYTEVKKMIQSLVEANLRETGTIKAKTSFGTSYGFTQPKPKLRLNQSAWQKALDENEELFKLVYQVDFQNKRLESAQKEYLEEYTPDSRIFIK